MASVKHQEFARTVAKQLETLRSELLLRQRQADENVLRVIAREILERESKQREIDAIALANFTTARESNLLDTVSTVVAPFVRSLLDAEVANLRAEFGAKKDKR